MNHVPRYNQSCSYNVLLSHNTLPALLAEMPCLFSHARQRSPLAVLLIASYAAAPL